VTNVIVAFRDFTNAPKRATLKSRWLYEGQLYWALVCVNVRLCTYSWADKHCPQGNTSVVIGEQPIICHVIGELRLFVCGVSHVVVMLSGK